MVLKGKERTKQQHGQAKEKEEHFHSHIKENKTDK